MAERAHGCCEYCRSQERFATHSFSVEHITPRRRGGASVQDNLAFSCQGCNNHKYTKMDARDGVGAHYPWACGRRWEYTGAAGWSVGASVCRQEPGTGGRRAQPRAP